MLLEMTRATQAGLRQERQYEIISNHLANSGTTGFKKDILTFDQAMKATLTTDHSSGDIQLTGNKLDLALSGKGFFKIETPNGLRYTRNGNFSLNTQGQIVTGKGDLVQGDAGPITVPGSDVFINEAGEVFSDGEQVDNLSMADFDSYALLKKDEANNYRYEGNAQDEKPAQDVKVFQGGLEAANLSVVTEMTKMIESHRMYETISKMMRTIDELDGEANGIGSAD
ncbi:MAG: flagellar hook-basal body protein [Proteobacteria bacterium]|nr:flagellar hook-basal body protein [Pseudomonadota bacterium]